jgi:S1-C subfamily serine protease
MSIPSNINKSVPKTCANCQGEVSVTNPKAKSGSTIRCYLCAQISTLQERAVKDFQADFQETDQDATTIDWKPIWITVVAVITIALGLGGYIGFKRASKSSKILTQSQTSGPDKNRPVTEDSDLKKSTNTPSTSGNYTTLKPSENKSVVQPDENQNQIETPSPEILEKLKKDKWLRFLWSEITRSKVTVKKQDETQATILYNQEERSVPIEVLPEWLQEVVKSQFYEEGVKNGSIREVDGNTYDTRTDKNWVTIRGTIFQILAGNEGYLVQISATETGSQVTFERGITWVNKQWTPVLVRLLANGLKTGMYEKQVIKIKALYIGNHSYESRAHNIETVPTYDAGIVVNGDRSKSRKPDSRLHPRPRSSPPKRESRPGSSGSGFFITSNGFFISNSHVVESAKEIEVVHNEQTSKARVVVTDPKNDIAILKVDTQNPVSWLNIGNASNVTEGEDVGTFGYPLPSLQGVNPKFSKGVVQSLTGADDDSTEFQISVPVQPGNSGGPLFQITSGNVIGIVSSRLRDSVVYGESGSLPQNINYAVKINYVIALIESRKEIVLKPALIKLDDQTSINAHIKNSIGRVLAYDK